MHRSSRFVYLSVLEDDNRGNMIVHIVIDNKGETVFHFLTDIRMSIGTSDTTVISSTKTEAHNLNTTIASATQRVGSYHVKFHTHTADNTQKHIFLTVGRVSETNCHPPSQGRMYFPARVALYPPFYTQRRRLFWEPPPLWRLQLQRLPSASRSSTL